MATHREIVRKRTHGYQAAAAALLAAAGAAIALPLGSLLAPSAPPKPSAPSDSTPRGFQPARIDTARAAETFKAILGWKPAPEKPPEPAAANPAPAAPAPAREWVYAGSMIAPSG